MGGWEVAAIQMAHALARRGKNVVVICHLNDAQDTPAPNLDVANGAVCFLDNEAFEPFLDWIEGEGGQEIELLVASRYPAFLRQRAAIRNTFLWVHDTRPNGELDITKVDRVLCLSPWHQSHLARLYDAWPLEKICITRNGIDPTRFSEYSEAQILPFRFIYSSSALRGLELLLAMWPRIRAEFPVAELHLFTNRHSMYIQKRAPEFGRRLVRTIANSEGVVLRGRTSQDELAKEFFLADAWLYPTSFEETYCITALEAQASGTLCICPPTAALATTVGPERGVMIPPVPAGTFRNDRVGLSSYTEQILSTLRYWLVEHRDLAAQKRTLART